MSISKTLSGAVLALAASCAGSPPSTAPPLAGMEEPFDLRAWPDDDAERLALPSGAFSGIVAADARTTLDALAGGGAPGALRVERVVENAPADAAGIEVDDLLVEAGLGDGAARPLGYVADWRALELAGGAGDRLFVLVDRAGARRRVELVLEARVRPADAPARRRVREEHKVGLVLRTATEVEARAAGLAPGGGAVVVGLALESPWRRVGIGFGDLIAEIDGREVRDVDVVLAGIQRGGDAVALALVRGGERVEVAAPLSSRARRIREFYVPLLFSYEHDRGRTSLSMVLDLISWESTKAAWDLTLVWFITLQGGDADRLREVDL
jgi:C-terminal processing protease CtpA/Prc